MLMDLNVSMMAVSCAYTVTFFGALFGEVGHTLTTHPINTISRVMSGYVWKLWTNHYTSCTSLYMRL